MDKKYCIWERIAAAIICVAAFLGFGCLTSYLFKNIPNNYWDLVVVACALISAFITIFSIIAIFAVFFTDHFDDLDNEGN